MTAATVYDVGEVSRRVGRRLAAARRRAGLTQQAVADEMGCSPARLAGWECGTRGIPVLALAQAARVIGVPVAVLLADGPVSSCWACRRPL